jgi:hypothetical protein
VLPLGAIVLVSLAAMLGFALRRRVAEGTPESETGTLSIFRT